jgi:prepilin-type N-terminal cleavage/methylation domain-containing protein
MRQLGLTLIELMIVIAIAAVLIAMAAPAFNDLLITQRAKGAAEGLVAALQNTKAQTAKANEITSIVFKPAATGTAHASWCYGMTDVGDATCDCSATPTDCAIGSVVDGDTYKDVTMEFNSSDLRSFEPVTGSAANSTNGTVIFRAGNNKDLGVTVSTIGRIRVCRPAGTNISRYQDSGACP